jgi:O-antigen/teichoic acid export membrane protein
VLALALAALASGSLLARHLRHREAWSESGAHGILRQILPLGLWSAAGAAIHWAFSQGYSFLVAGSLNVSAVAALAAMRMLLTPVNLLSCGISSLMLGMTSSWLQKYPVTVVFRRQLLFASGLAGAALCYTLLVWLLRDWICAHVLKRQFAQRDTLLLLWSAVFLVMVFRDQLVSLLVVRERLRRLTALTFASALCSLAVSGWGISKFGTPGALLGVLTGELINVGGLVLLSLREAAQEHEPELHAAVGLAGK